MQCPGDRARHLAIGAEFNHDDTIEPGFRARIFRIRTSKSGQGSHDTSGPCSRTGELIGGAHHLVKFGDLLRDGECSSVFRAE